MRSFDNLQVLFDGNGNPLYGRVTFYRLHTTELLPIYNEDGTVPLQNPMPTSQRGLTDVQVFLQDQDYTVKLERWIGAGDMVLDDPNSEDWEDVRTFDNLYPAILLETPDGQPGVVELSTMDALRHLDIRTAPDINYVKLLGYYSLGDMPPQYYKLETNSNPSIIDDGGSVIRPDVSTNKIWRLIPQENIDVRVFGVFSSPSIEALTAYNSQLHYCFQYANNIGKDVYMPQRFNGRGYYFIEGGTHSLRQKLVADEGVQIVAKPLTTSRLQIAEIQFYGNELFVSTGSYGTLYVDCPTVRTSWKCNSWAQWSGNVGKIIVDTLNSSFAFDGVTVEFEKEISDKTLTFTDCLITSNKKIKDCTVILQDCGEVTDRWFSTGNTFQVVSGNLLKGDNFEDVNLYIDFMNKQLDPVYGDLGERTVTGKTLLANAVVENAVFNNVTLSGDTELHNISGSVNLSGTGYSLNIVDCWLAVNGTGVVLNKIQWRRGSFSNLVSPIQALSQCELWDVEVNTALITNGIAVARFERCSINKDVTGQGIVCKDCHIHATVTTSDVGGRVNFNFDGCYFGQNGRHSVTGSNIGTQVVGTWVNNFSESVHPIILDMTKLSGNDASHSYNYVNNNGKFLPRYPKKTWIDNGWATPGAAWGFEYQFNLASPFKVIESSVGGLLGIGDFIGMGVHDLEVDMPFFSIGACTAVFKLSVSFEGNMKYGDRAFTQSYAFVGECTDTISAPAFYKCTSFNEKIIGKPTTNPRWVNNSDWPKSCVATFERVK